MTNSPTSNFDPFALRLGSELRRIGIDPARERWHRVRRGVWMPTPVWQELGIDERHRALVHATLLCCDEPDAVVLAAHSAAALWGMPIIGSPPGQVFVFRPEARSGPSGHLRLVGGAPVDAVTRAGVLVTPAARTVIDLARHATLETALAAADFALGTRLCSREELAAQAGLIPPGARGRSRAALTVDLADGRSGSAGESLSRLQMFRANFPRPVLQREYRDEHGSMFTDFDWEGLIGEFDGKLKYRVPEGTDPRQAGEIVWREKTREDRLRRHKRVVRWVFRTARSTSALARVLIGAGLRPEPRSTWIDLGSRSASGR